MVEDDADLCEALAEFLKSKQFDIAAVSTYAEARRLLDQGADSFHLLLTDLMLADGDGLDLVELARKRNPAILAAVMTGYASLESALKAIHLGVYDYVTKPFSLGKIGILVRNMCERISLELELSNSRTEIEHSKEKLSLLYSRFDNLQDEKLELMRLNREMKGELARLSNKIDTILQICSIAFPNVAQRIRAQAATGSPAFEESLLPVVTSH